VNQIDFVLVETFLELGKDGSAVTVFDSSSRTLIEKNIICNYQNPTMKCLNFNKLETLS
jgi:hypothetical protein